MTVKSIEHKILSRRWGGEFKDCILSITTNGNENIMSFSIKKNINYAMLINKKEKLKEFWGESPQQLFEIVFGIERNLFESNKLFGGYLRHRLCGRYGILQYIETCAKQSLYILNNFTNDDIDVLQLILMKYIDEVLIYCTSEEGECSDDENSLTVSDEDENIDGDDEYEYGSDDSYNDSIS